jgi:hypothetical protein
MWPTWNTLPAGWTHAMRVVLVFVALCMSACTALSHSSSNPSDMPSDRGYVGPMIQGDGDGGM